MQPRAWFQCIRGCPGELPLTDVVYECPRCGALLEVAHDLGELQKQSSAYWTRTLRRPLQADDLAVRQRGLGQEGVGGAPRRGRQRRLAGRGRHQPLLGRAVRRAARPGRSLGQDVRQQPHRVVQRPRDDRAGLHGQADDRRGCADQGRGLRLDRRHLGGAGGLLRGGRHPGRGDPAARQDQRPAADPADRQRRAGALGGHRLRRLHGDGEAAGEGAGHLPGELDELAASRGPEDGQHRDGPAVRLGGAGLGHHPGRQPREHGSAGGRLPDDARAWA